MLQPGTFDWDVWRQDDEPTTFAITDDETGEPIDLSGASAYLQVRRYGGETGAPLLSVSSEGASANGSVITFTDPGTMDVALSLGDLAALPGTQKHTGVAEYVYDIVIVWADGKGAPYVTGKFILHEGATVRA